MWGKTGCARFMTKGSQCAKNTLRIQFFIRQKCTTGADIVLRRLVLKIIWSLIEKSGVKRVKAAAGNDFWKVVARYPKGRGAIIAPSSSWTLPNKRLSVVCGWGEIWGTFRLGMGGFGEVFLLILGSIPTPTLPELGREEIWGIFAWKWVAIDLSPLLSRRAREDLRGFRLKIGKKPLKIAF